MWRVTAVLAACVIAGCGGEAAEKRERAAAPAKTPERADGVDTVAERVMEEVPGCTPDETDPVTPDGKKVGVVAIRTGICEDSILDAATVIEFRDAKSAKKQRRAYWLLDDPQAKDGELVANGNVVCHEQFKGGKDLVNCMLVVNEYIVVGYGRRGKDTSAVMDERIGALGRAAE